MSFFYYFGYGSNLLLKRIRVQNKSAERVGVGRLDGYRLDFADTGSNPQYYSARWNGSPATIIPVENSSVYGAVWKINNSDLEQLDDQEGVNANIYKPLELSVYVEELQSIVTCRSYQLVLNPLNSLDPMLRDTCRQPSKTYLTVILNGAVESKLPPTYVDFLKSFTHNGKEATDVNLTNSLDLKEIL